MAFSYLYLRSALKFAMVFATVEEQHALDRCSSSGPGPVRAEAEAVAGFRV